MPNGTGLYTVTDAYSIPVGEFNTATNTIVDAATKNPIVVGVDLSTLPIVNPDKTIFRPDGSITDLLGNKISGGDTTPNSSSAAIPGPGIVVSSSSLLPIVSSSSAKTPNPIASSSSQQQPKPASSSSQQQPKSSSAKSDKQCNGQCYDSASDKCVGYHDQQTGSKGEKYAYDESCKLNCYYDPNNKNCQDMTGAAPASSSSQQPKSSSSAKSSSSTQQPKSSSSQPKSSSSQPKSSSSSAPKSSSSQSNPNASAEEAQYLNAGAGGQQGFATRYWDCCMPHCAWPEHGGKAKTCDAKGKNFVQGGQNICAGGQNTTCTSQIPIIASDKVAYAFAATHANSGGKCGKCFALTFTGSGKYESKANHQALAGKTLVVMASNIGGDVEGNQFDIMIPGGGLGMFKNGCSQMFSAKKG